MSELVCSDVTVAGKYARFDASKGRREVFDEIVDRVEAMHLAKYGHLGDAVTQEIKWALDLVRQRLVLPSMRTLQFGGDAILRDNMRAYNCCFRPIDSLDFFFEQPLLLLWGCGVGYSVKARHIEKLPVFKGFSHKRARYKIEDTIQGWAKAFYHLVRAAAYGWRRPVFDFSAIRRRGAPLKTSGGLAPGPAPLRAALAAVEARLLKVRNRRMTSLELHDLACIVSDCVVAGGVRRSAMIAIFDPDDEEMISCKSGDWITSAPWRARANNSAHFLRSEVTREQFDRVFEECRRSPFSEPGAVFTNDPDWGVNPCVEAALRPFQCCNLTTIGASNCRTEQQFLDACRAAAILGTLQSGYTDFRGLRRQWREQAISEPLLGISITGILDRPGLLTGDLKSRGAQLAVATNKEMAAALGINPAARITLGKPDGTASLVLGCASGIHPRHSQYYLRRTWYAKDEPIVKFLTKHIPARFFEQDAYSANKWALTFPIASPEGAITGEQLSACQLLDLVTEHHKAWIAPGHQSGENQHNQSVTLTVRDHEWSALADKVWASRDVIQGVSMTRSITGYPQMPFEAITADQYEEMARDFPAWIDFSQWREGEDTTELHETIACAGGACAR